MEQSLHPNLARIAAEYDEVVKNFKNGMLTQSEARRRVLALTARDDEGLEWSFDPDTGMWRYQNKWGDYVLSDPPLAGVMGLAPEDIGASGGRTQDERISFIPIGASQMYTNGGLRGSTQRENEQNNQAEKTGLVVKLVLGASVLIVLGIVLSILF